MGMFEKLFGRQRRVTEDNATVELPIPRGPALQVGNHGNGFPLVTSKRKQKCVQFLIIGIDCLNQVFLPLKSVFQCHSLHLFSHLKPLFFRLVYGNRFV